MNYKDILRYNKELRLCNINNISQRLLNASQQDVFVAYNTLKGRYELHSVQSFRYNGISYNANIDIEDMHYGLVKEFRMNDYKKYAQEVEDHRQVLTTESERHGEKQLEYFLDRGMKMVQRTLGREI